MTNTAMAPSHFVGISLPAELHTVVDTIKKSVHMDDEHTLKPLIPHITLLHPSSLQHTSIEILKQEIELVSSRVKPFTVTLDDIDFFEREVCYVRATSPQLDALQHSLVQLLPKAQQSEYNSRRFIAHVTVAQKNREPQLDTATLTKYVRSTIQLPLHFTVDSIDIFSRTAPRAYSVIERIALR